LREEGWSSRGDAFVRQAGHAFGLRRTEVSDHVIASVGGDVAGTSGMIRK